MENIYLIILFFRGSVFGTMVYAEESSICKAAIHAGFIKDHQGGEVVFVIANGQESYVSSFKNEIHSSDYGLSQKSFFFRDALPIKKIGCLDNASGDNYEGPPGTKFRVYCPKLCSQEAQKVNGGNPLYTDDSSICQAAIHKGVLTDIGGEVVWQYEKGQISYKGDTRNGIRSIKHEEYIRSIRIFGDTKGVCAYFTETYNPSDILVNYEVIDFQQMKKGPSHWEFRQCPTCLHDTLTIGQVSECQGDKFNYCTMLKNKNFDCADGHIKTSVYFEELGEAAILFRYQDPNNYYALEFNFDQIGIRLIKKFDKNKEILWASDIVIYEKQWFKFHIVFFLSNIQIWMKDQDRVLSRLLFNTTDPDMGRGMMGFATNNNAHTFFDEISVTDYDPRLGLDEQEDENLLFNTCISHAPMAKRRHYCKQYGTILMSLDDCVDKHNYCDVCCNQVVPKVINIANFQCWRECVKATQDAEKKEDI